MLTPKILAEYRKLRAESPYTPAKWLLQTAKRILQEPSIELENDYRAGTYKYSGTHEGFQVNVRCEPMYDEQIHLYTSDESKVLEWLGSAKGLRKNDLSIYRNEEAWCDGEPLRGHKYHTYVLPLGYDTDLYLWDSILANEKLPLHIAVELAKQEIAKGMKHLDEYTSWFISVTASKEGIELGEDSLGGIIVSPGERPERTLAEYIDDDGMICNAIEAAKRNLTLLCSCEEK